MNGTSALNQWAETWAALAWNGLIESTILLGVIALIWLALRRRISSHAAYWLFLLVVIKAMLPLEIRAPQWLAQWTPQQAVIATVERAAPPIAMVAPASPPPVSFPRETAIEPVEMRMPATAVNPAPSALREPLEPQGGMAAVERSHPPLTTQSWLMLAWAVIAGGLLVRFAYNHLRARRYLRGLRPISPSEMRMDYARLLALSGLRKPVPVYASPHIGSPAAFGLLRPCVIVPEDFFDSLKPEQASWALLHELAHIRRRDLWATAFQRVARIAHFYNPAVWIANWAVDRFREYACDDEALALSGVNRKTCGAGLLNVAERAVFTPKPVAETLGLLQTSSMIRRRLERILDARRVLQPRLSRPALLALILLGAVLLPYVRGIDSPDATDTQTRTDISSFTMENAEPRAVDADSYRLAGSLIDQESGDPIGAGALMQLYDHHERTYGVRELRFETRANAEGRFAFDEVPAGDYWPRIVAEGYKVFEPVGDPRVIDPFERITVGAANEGREYAIPLERGQAVEIVALTPDGQPAANAEVLLIQSYTRVPIEGRTDAQGRFLFTSLNGQPAYAMVRKEGFGETGSEVFRGGPLESPQRVETRLTPPATLTGRVLNREDGEPYPDAPVYARFAGDYPRATNTPGLSPHVVTTDEGGRYLFEGLGEGPYYISLPTWQPFLRDRSRSFDSETPTEQVELRAGEIAALDFHAKEYDLNNSIRVRVLSTESQPIPGVQVTIHTRPISEFARNEISLAVTYKEFTDASGEAIIQHLVPHIDFSVSLDSEEFIDIREPMERDLIPRTDEVVEFRMARAGSIRGKVINAESGAPIPDAIVSVKDESRRRIYSKTANTTQDGAFEVTGLDEAHYEVRLVAPGARTMTFPEVHVELGKVTMMEIELESGAALQGVIRNRQGEPISGAKLHLKSQAIIRGEGVFGVSRSAQMTVAAESDANGAYRLSNIQPDGDVLVVTAPDHGPKRISITQEAIAMGRLDVTLGDGGTIRGRVLGHDGAPRAGARIQVFNFPENLFGYNAIANEIGEYEISGLPEEMFHVRKYDPVTGDYEYRLVDVREGETAIAGFGTGERVAIEGTVCDRDGSPIPNAMAILKSDSEERGSYLFAFANEEGRYQFFHDLLPGEYLLTFNQPLDRFASDYTGMYGVNQIARGTATPGYEGGMLVHIMEDQTPQYADLQTGQRQVSVRLVDAETGEPLEEVFILGQDPRNHNQSLEISNANGEIQFESATLGTYSLYAFKQGYESLRFEAKVKPESETPRSPTEIAMRPVSAWIKATLLEDNQPLDSMNAHFIIHSKPFSLGSVQSLHIEPVEEEMGSFWISGFSPGSFDLYALVYQEGERPRLRWISQLHTVSIAEGQTLHQDFEVFRARSYQIEFHTPDGEEIPYQFEITVEDIPGDTSWRGSYIGQNRISAMLPIDRGPARIKFPGYQPVEFTPEDIPTEPYSPIELRFDLKRE